ncbi:QcrA and Rieske domain-containing protein [Halostella pelagica]|uniref:QcrA and Rieske domain-containing protein n=1 Tax=Halostella pelagica TaxID=2583824 RepID=UPI001081B294|nr:Rieske 2Fe-2S domain-containing protein [Halostella pelagica]
MPEDEDKYPVESDRRRFVKGVVGSAALAGVGTTGAVAVNSATEQSGAGGGATTAMAIENTDGPAPRGMPQIPIEIEDGEIKGVWPEVTEIEQQGQTVTITQTKNYKGTDVTYSSRWFQYCGVQSYSGLKPEADQENFFRYSSSPPPTYGWQTEEVSGGDRVQVSDFEGYENWENSIGSGGLGKPAAVTWRSQDVDNANTIPVTLIRSKRIEEKAQENDWLAASTDKGFMAYLNKCTHFCCVPGWKTSEQASQFNAEDDVYCPCHQSVYDPFEIVETTFTALPVPAED